METPRAFTQAEIRTALDALETGAYGEVLRAKDYVPGEVDVRTGGADVTGRLCVIGAHLKEQDLAALFHL